MSWARSNVQPENRRILLVSFRWGSCLFLELSELQVKWAKRKTELRREHVTLGIFLVGEVELNSLVKNNKNSNSKNKVKKAKRGHMPPPCLLYTSDAADE